LKVGHEALQLHVGHAWALAWLAWLASGALLPLPPWNAGRLLALEERKAAALAEGPSGSTAWSIDVGAPRQGDALGVGWSVNEAFHDQGARRTFVWIEGARAEVSFSSSDWPQAQLAVEASPLDGLAPLAVDVALDGEGRDTLLFPSGWNTVRLALGPLQAGRHVLGLRPRAQASPPGEARALSLAVDGIGLGASRDLAPSRDRGVFAGRLRAGLEERPALYVSAEAEAPPLPPGSVRIEVEPGLVAWYGFGVGGPARTMSSVIVVLNGLLAAALVTLVPGLAWSARFGRAGGVLRLGEILASSTLAWLAVFVALRLVGASPEGWPLVLAIALAGAAPLPFLRARQTLALPWSALGAALPAVLVLSLFATAVVPPLEDQDMEVQATAHALATRQAPLALTNRGTPYFFAHPPLLHLWQAGSFAVAGRLERVRYYADAGAAALGRPFVEPLPGAPLAARPHYEEWKSLLRRFLTEPQLWPTRQVNVLLAALAVGVAAHLAGAVAGSTALGLALAGVLLSFPEFLVRGAYGGYFASTTLLTLVLLAGLGGNANVRGLAVGGTLAFLANQKGLLVPVAWAVAAPQRIGRGRFVPLAGALLGAAAYTSYGFAVDRQSFVYDFLKEHVARRLAPSNLRFESDVSRWYPSIPELWVEFGARYGWLFLLLAALATIRGLWSRRAEVRAAAAAVLLGAAVFSVTDWRQTKHLSLLAAPALVALADFAPRTRSGRRAVLVVCMLLCLRNLWHAWPLLTRFEALRPGTTW